MGKRKRARQPGRWVATTDLPRAASQPFYTRLYQLLREHGFDDFAEAQCATFYAETIGRPSLPPGVYFQLLLTVTGRDPYHFARTVPISSGESSCRKWRPFTVTSVVLGQLPQN
jgi:hypothetical protein